MNKSEVNATEFEKDCQLYMQLHAKEARLRERMNVLKDRIIPELQKGKKSPSDLPYALVLRERLVTIFKWKESLQSQLKLWLGEDEKVEERMSEIQSGFETETVEALYVEINKSYAAKMKKPA